MMIKAKMTKTSDQCIPDNKYCAKGGPTTWPALPAAVVMPSASERCLSEAALPTTPRSTPKPVPAIPNPTSTSSS